MSIRTDPDALRCLSSLCPHTGVVISFTIIAGSFLLQGLDTEIAIPLPLLLITVFSAIVTDLKQFHLHKLLILRSIAACALGLVYGLLSTGL